MKKSISAIVVLIIVISFMGVNSVAEEYEEYTEIAESSFFFDISENKGKREDSFVIAVNYDGNRGDIGAFAVTIEYDSYNFTYSKVDVSDKVKSAYHTTKDNGSSVSSVFTTKTPNLNNNISGPVFMYTFKANADAETGNHGFKIKVEQTVSNKANPAEYDYEEKLDYYIMPLPSEDANLYELRPDRGILQPAFSPDIYEYNLSVPFEVKSIKFEAKTAETSNYRVNRTNLGAGGSEVDFIISVTAENKSYTSKYTVTARREEKIVENKESVSSEAKSNKSSSSSSSSKSEKVSSSNNANSSKTNNKSLQSTSSKSKTSNKSYEKEQTHYPEEELEYSKNYSEDRGFIVFESDNFRGFLIGILSTVLCMVGIVAVVFLVKRTKDSEKENSKNKDNKDKKK